MNSNHATLMPSPEWAAHIQDEVLPQATEGVSLGADLLELGPGPGAATDWLRRRVRRLVAVEQEGEAAARLADRFAGSNVEVACGDAAALGYPDASFDTVATCTMLHHVPTRARQDKVLAEAFRVLRPGGRLVFVDPDPRRSPTQPAASWGVRWYDEADHRRMFEDAGFTDVTVRYRGMPLYERALVLSCRKPGEPREATADAAGQPELVVSVAPA